MGHIRDLPKKELGVDVENDFEPKYEIPTRSKKVLTALKKDAQDVDEIVLATDPDREGEAIAWHLSELLKKRGRKFSRVAFHELTKDAVEEAFAHPSELNDALVDAQKARRVLDRLVGYKLSPLLWKKVRYGLSAGRVQSVAVRLIVERERERDAFKPEEYWTIDCEFENGEKHKLTASLAEKDGKKVDLSSQPKAEKVEKDLGADKFSVSSVKKSERTRKAYPPLRTSTLQQMAANIFGFSAKKTMSAAQKLFERGYITYHRTDSVSLSPEFAKGVRVYIKEEFGAKYLPEEAVSYKTKAKNAQEAHEAIRPTSVKKAPATLPKSLSEDEVKIYSLIWRRAVESQMLPAIYDQTHIMVASAKGYLLKAGGSIIKFDGWLAVGKFLGMNENGETLIVLEEFTEGEALDLKNVEKNQHFTQPPPRYSDASLIKALEEMEIGRPSTYAPTISTIQSRKYVIKENRYFIPEDVAFVVTDLLVEHFPSVVDYEFTADMEEMLDKVSNGDAEWVPEIRKFYTPFEKDVKKKDKELQKSEVTTLGVSDEKCPECGKPLNIKLGKYGKFLSCSGFPDCEFAKPIEDENTNPDEDYGKCENCGADMILKQGRYGKFLACSKYPECKTTKPYLEKIGMKCPECKDGEVIVKKAKGRTFYGCSNYPKCKYASWKNPLPQEEE